MSYLAWIKNLFVAPPGTPAARREAEMSDVGVEKLGNLVIATFRVDRLGFDGPEMPDSAPQDRPSANLESMFHFLANDCQDSTAVLLDLTQVRTVEPPGTLLLSQFLMNAARAGKSVGLCRPPSLYVAIIQGLQLGLSAPSFAGRLEGILRMWPKMNSKADVSKLLQMHFSCECAATFQCLQAVAKGHNGPVFLCPNCKKALFPIENCCVEGLHEP